MGIFSNISDFFKSSNLLAKTSRKQHMENVEKNGIKVLEIQRKGTESTVVKIPVEENSRLERYAKNVSNDSRITKGSLLERLKPLVYRTILWGIRDLRFYDEFSGSAPHFNKIVISLSKNTVNIAILLGGEEYSIAYSNGYFKHFPEYLNNYVLPFEDRSYFSRLLEEESQSLAKSDITVVWDIVRITLYGVSEGQENPYKGKYYIYNPNLGVYSHTSLQGVFLPYGREDFPNLLAHAYHLDSEEQAKAYLDNVIKPRIKRKGGKVGDLQILSSARVYSEVQKLKGKSPS